MLNHVEYPSSVKEGTETPGAFDQNGQRFYVLDRLQEQASRIRYLLDTTVFFRNQLETCQAAGNAEAAQSTYLSLSSGRIGIANGVRSLKPLLLELEHPAASICEALVDQISSFELMTRDYSKFSGVISRFLDALPSYHTRGILPIENPFVSTLEEAVNRALRMNSYSYDYCLYDSLRDKKGPKLVLIVDDEFEAYYDIPDALFSILDICKDGIDHLETELARLKREAEENKRKVIAFPKKKNARRRKEAA